MTGERVLVTGGAGFIGSHYVRRLLADPGDRDLRVTVLDLLTYAGRRANLAEAQHDRRLTFVHGDVCDPVLTARLVAAHDTVVHFAAETHVDRSIARPHDFVRTNVLGTQYLLDAARRHHGGQAVFVHISTDEVYGSIEEGAWPETAPLCPTSPYAAAKAAADLLVLAYHRTYGLDVRITRCSNNYGPRQYPEKLIPSFIISLLGGRPVPLYGDGRQRRDWLHVEDHVEAVELVRLKGRPGEVYHVGGGTELSNRELTEKLVELCGASADLIRPAADRLGHDRRYRLDDSKTAGELGYAPRHTFDRSLAATVEWYRVNRTWWEPLR
ncbi:dTDP-glucose 4,6-dehydratase [Actinoplanes sp. TFC3]|uniref:dTDP-glucose 4,6-dehydratase n=1 Tax=Actinoplanes sp. TFC3 TaxID=1710355 RepID=UPI00082FA17F|nr:dTDP-glucose 4,6-dehydratase [Actinoplanes sp. TFC3]